MFPVSYSIQYPITFGYSSEVCTLIPSQVEYQETIQVLFSQNNWLTNQVRMLRQTIDQMSILCRQKLQILKERRLIRGTVSSPKKEITKFKKSIECPHSQCNRRYSSKIALNQHIKIKHTAKLKPQQ